MRHGLDARSRRALTFHPSCRSCRSERHVDDGSTDTPALAFLVTAILSPPVHHHHQEGSDGIQQHHQVIMISLNRICTPASNVDGRVQLAATATSCTLGGIQSTRSIGGIVIIIRRASTAPVFPAIPDHPSSDGGEDYFHLIICRL